MRIFWSWQSDLPGKTGRHFIRNVIAEAIESLKQDIEVQEPTERDLLGAMHLDQDRAGVPGSPDLARIILEKIEQSAVFIGDVTPIAVVQASALESSDAKKVMNPNVAIELGYALHALTDRNLLMVLNEHYGGRETLPFDLRHKAGPLIYNLPPDADRTAIDAQAKQLRAQFVSALRLCLTEQTQKVRAEKPFTEQASAVPPAMYFESGEVLASPGYKGEQEFRIDEKRLVYLRLFPASAGQPPLRLETMNETFRQRRPRPLSLSNNGLFERNKYGPLIYDPVTHVTIGALTQGFAGCELWGINCQMFQRTQWNRIDARAEPNKWILPIITFEKTIYRILENYLTVAESLDRRYPFVVEFGLTDLTDTFLAAPGIDGRSEYFGPIMQNSFSEKFRLNSSDGREVATALRNAFESFYDLAATSREAMMTDQHIANYQLPPLRD